MLGFFSASNDIVNSQLAMEDCIQRALANEGNSDCDLIIFHTTMGHDFNELLETASRLCPNAKVAGCTGMGVIGREGPIEKMRALAIMVMKGEAQDFSVVSCESINGSNSYEVGLQLATEMKAGNPNVNMICALASGYDIAVDKLIEGIEVIYGQGIPIFGGTASDNLKMKNSFQFVNNRILEDGVVLVGFSDPSLEVVMGAHYGNNAIGLPFEVTCSQGNRIDELDGNTAWPYLMEKLNQPPTASLREVIALICMGEPLEPEFHEEYENKLLLRIVIKVDENNESFYMPTECPAGTKLWLVERDEKLIFAGLDRLLVRLQERLQGRTPLAVFHTDCCARGRLMFNQVVKDEIISRMQLPFTDNTEMPWLGLYGVGEIAQIKGRNFFHNQTTSLYMIVKRT